MGKNPEEENCKSLENVELELEEEAEDEEEEEVVQKLEEEEVVQKLEEEEVVQKLEEEVKEMAQKILDYRTTLPDQLESTLASVLAAQRPVIHTQLDSGSESIPGSSSDPNPVRPSGSGNEVLIAGEDEDTEKIKLLKEKISSNAESIPVVLKRMKDCMARIDQLESQNGIIHPAFKRKKPS